MLKAIHHVNPSVNKIEVTDENGNQLATYFRNTDTMQLAPGVTGESILRAFYKDRIAEMPAPPKLENTK